MTDLVDPLDLAIEATYGAGLEPSSEENGGRGRPRDLETKAREVARLGFNELLRRLRDKEQASLIKDADLIKLIDITTKMLERKPQQDQEGQRQTVQVLQIVQQDGLPPERQARLLNEAIEMARRAGEPVRHLEDALKVVTVKTKETS